MSDDCEINLNRLKDKYLDSVFDIKKTSDLEFKENDIIIDAIFGSGLKRETGGEFADVIKKINQSGNIVLSVDIPSGLFGEDNTDNNGAIVNACITYAL
ncbi:MAG: hypothetical protein C0596_16350 [Marinilabiliales bacterium]|nr:MAG: hypothetical protein C0596_16350 [Marinilabiliales bacterium]